MRYSEAVKKFHFQKKYEYIPVGAPNGYGEIFTRRDVVEFILDLAGYTCDKPLFSYRLLEPSFGLGDFLEPVIERLLIAYKRNFSGLSNITKKLSDAIRAVEINSESVNTTREKLLSLLRKYGVSKKNAIQLLDAWIIEGDFLLLDLPHLFTHAVGNPPYIRQELIPKELIAKYRAKYTTIYDRADLYIPFIERCLTSIVPGGVVGLICADRWMKNRFGKPLRAMISKNYHLVYYVDMIDTPAFHKDVIAYPAITIIKRERPGNTRIARRPEINRTLLAKLAKDIKATTIPQSKNIVEIADVAKSQEPWILQSSAQLNLVRRLEARFPVLEDAGCKVGIGVATGADKVYIGPFSKLDVELDRKLPLVKTKDIRSGTIEWQGLGVINPFRDGGSLVSLDEYPKLSKYLKRHRAQILRRHVAKANRKGWFRTIDRIYSELTYRPKLLIPDIKGEALIVYDDGRFYPHHNLYYITSEEWDLKALQSVLRSGIAKLFISLYSTRMRGGYFRYQAQYLRRIRLPRWIDVPDKVRESLLNAAKAGEVEICNKAVFDLYGLDYAERVAIEGNGGGRQ